MSIDVRRSLGGSFVRFPSSTGIGGMHIVSVASCFIVFFRLVRDSIRMPTLGMGHR